MTRKKFPAILMCLKNTTNRPDGNELIRLLRLWYKHSPSVNSPYNEYGHDPYFFLRWLIKGRVVDTLDLLYQSDNNVDHDIADRIWTFGLKTLTNGPSQAKVMTNGFWGWIGTEIGNPTWGNSKDKIIVELPTAGLLKAYMQMVGAEYSHSPFFEQGFYCINQATKEQFDCVNAITTEKSLRGYSLWGGGLWVYSTVRSARVYAEAQAREAAKDQNDRLVQLQQLSDEIMISTLEKYAGTYSPPVLDPNTRNRIVTYMKNMLDKNC